MQTHLDDGRSRMSCHVRQRLLRDPEQVGFGLILQPHINVGVVVDNDACSLREAFRQPPERGVETEIIEDDRAEQLRQLAHIRYRTVDEIERIRAAR